MRNLILKDFLLQKKFIYFALGYSLFIFFVFQQPMFTNFLYSTGAIIIAYIFIMNAIAHDNRSDIILNSLPIRRERIVLAKYLTVLVMMVLAIGIMALTGGIIKIMGLPMVQRFINIRDIIITFTSAGILSAIYLPINYKFSNKYLRIVNIILLMAAFSIPANVVKLVVENQSFPLVQKLILIYSSYSELIGGFAICVTLVIMLLSLVLSQKIYKNKEFRG